MGESRDVGPLYGKTMTVRGPELTVRDELLLIDAMTRYVRAGCPEHRVVELSLGEYVRLGGKRLGGWQRNAIKATLHRLRSVSIESAFRLPDGREDWMVWGLIDAARTTRQHETGRGWLRISQELAALLRAGSVTLIHGPTLEALIAADELAARLWTFLEAEDLRGTGQKPFRYAIFPAPPRQPARDRNLPALADLLRLSDMKRWRVADRIASACQVIVKHDPRYRLAVQKGTEAGMYRLDAGRGPGPSTHLPDQPQGRSLDVPEVGRLMSSGRSFDGPESCSTEALPSYLPSSSTVVNLARAREDQTESTSTPDEDTGADVVRGAEENRSRLVAIVKERAQVLMENETSSPDLRLPHPCQGPDRDDAGQPVCGGNGRAARSGARGMNLTCHRCHRSDDEMALVVVALQFEHRGDCPPPDLTGPSWPQNLHSDTPFDQPSHPRDE